MTYRYSAIRFTRQLLAGIVDPAAEVRREVLETHVVADGIIPVVSSAIERFVDGEPEADCLEDDLIPRGIMSLCSVIDSAQQVSALRGLVEMDRGRGLVFGRHMEVPSQG